MQIVIAAWVQVTVTDCEAENIVKSNSLENKNTCPLDLEMSL